MSAGRVDWLITIVEVIRNEFQVSYCVDGGVEENLWL